MEYSVKNVYKNVACKKEHIMQEYHNFKNKLEIKNVCAMILQNCQKLKRIKLDDQTLLHLEQVLEGGLFYMMASRRNTLIALRKNFEAI